MGSSISHQWKVFDPFRQYYAPGAFTRSVELGELAETLKCLDSIDFK